MNRRVLLIGSGIVAAVLLGWYFLLFAPAGNDLNEAKDKLTAARADENSKTQQLKRLEALQAAAGTSQDTARLLEQLIPARAELASFIDSATAIAVRSGVDFLAVNPTPPVAGTGAGPSVIAVSMQIEGTFYELLQYLNALQDPDQMARLLVVDSISVTAKPDSIDFAGQSPTLAVTLSARMFTADVQAGAATGTSVPGSPSSSSTAPTSSVPSAPSGSTPPSAIS